MFEDLPTYGTRGSALSGYSPMEIPYNFGGGLEPRLSVVEREKPRARPGSGPAKQGMGDLIVSAV